MERSGELHLNELPEGCIANVLSFTAPLDVARLSAVSPMFKSAAISDVVWERFLPSDLESVLSTSPDGSLLLASVSSKRELYFSLCDNPILVDNGRKSFSLEKKSGKKCYMLSAMDLVIRWSDSPHYWKWNSNPASRFPEVAELIKVSWLEIRGKFNTSMLSPSILYTANLVFKFSISAYGLVDQPVEVAMKLDGDKICEHSVSWNAERRPVDFFIYSCRRSIPARESDGHYPKKRGDGWLEIELGDFLCTEGEDGELEMRVFDGINYWKHGLIVEGIEIRPKEVGASPSS
ncbi:F-box protein PP2-B11 [Populus alba]|uniref:F-box protein PP2-B11 n=1 Tax=Populus alba TaxID=43335 RepID=UPI003CC76829